MANKRIKISELPKISWDKVNPNASVSEKDYMAIAVTNPQNFTIKTTQTITTRELQRFLLLHDNGTEEGEWDKNLLKIGGASTTVELTGNVRVKNLEVEGNFTSTSPRFTNLNVASMSATGRVTAQTITIEGAAGNNFPLRVGASNYPSTLAGKWSMLGTKTDSGSPLREVSFSEMINNAQVTSNTNRPVCVNSSGQITFNKSYEQFFGSPNLFDVTGVGSKAGKIVFVDPFTGGFDFSDTTNDTLTGVISNFNATFTDGTGDGSVLECSNSSDALSGIPINMSASSINNNRAVFKSPVVLGAKHTDGIDLTERRSSYNLPAQLGEIRWNIFNNIPTLYMAVYNDTDAGGTDVNLGDGGSLVDIDINAKIWFGVPLFGTIPNTLNPSITAYKLDDLD